jgi:hypothetical protein
MTNTYEDNAPMEAKLYEEIRCLRCVNERLLRAMDEGLFTDYQMEKFSGSPEARAIKEKYGELKL